MRPHTLGSAHAEPNLNLMLTGSARQGKLPLPRPTRTRLGQTTSCRIARRHRHASHEGMSARRSRPGTELRPQIARQSCQSNTAERSGSLATVEACRTQMPVCKFRSAGRLIETRNRRTPSLQGSPRSSPLPGTVSPIPIFKPTSIQHLL